MSISIANIVDFLRPGLATPEMSETIILQAVNLDRFDEGCVSFAKHYDPDTVARANSISNGLLIVSEDYKGKLYGHHIISESPRLDFIRVVNRFFYESEKPSIHPTAHVSKEAVLGVDVNIGMNSFIGPEVTIGDRTSIHNNVSIIGKVRIGSDCIIKSGAVIGEEGFGFEYDENGVPQHFPHIGEIVLGNRVYIGSNTTIERAALSATILEDDVKVDDLIQIGHHCHVKRNTMIMCGAVLCGGVCIDESCWIAPNVSIRQRVHVGANATVGLGAVVIKDVAASTVVAGNPATIIKKDIV